MTKFTLRKMKEHEVQIAIDWAQKEGWNPGLGDAKCFYQADPDGFFIGLLDDEPIAVGSAVIYSDNYAFCGLYIVKPEYRSHGYGLQLTQERLKYVGNRVTGIDGVVENVSKYEKIGYVPAYKQVRYELKGNKSFSTVPEIVDVNTLPFHLLEEYDQKYFPASRTNFLRCWINNTKALAYMKNQRMMGYGVIRKCNEGYKIGPLNAESPDIARTLFDALNVNEEPIYLDIPEPNKDAQALVKEYGMTPKFEVIRMYRNGSPNVDIDKIYGVTTFELG